MTTDAEMQDRLTAALGGRYSVDREVGRGGMATVYLAQDLDGGHPVAVKVMDPRLNAVIEGRRFDREIAVVRAMTHPHIVPLWHSGEAGGFRYFVMPYVDGETLYQRLQRERRLPLEEALPIVHDVAAALGHAHEQGVVHRDVKPENILLTGGRALVADFGLALSVGREYTRLTMTGMMVGSIYYMSPEQLREEEVIDARADIYSLGCVLFEMLTGGPPFTGASLRELVGRILAMPAPSVRRVAESVPRAVDEAIGRALAKHQSERFASMTEFVTALQGR